MRTWWVAAVAILACSRSSFSDTVSGTPGNRRLVSAGKYVVECGALPESGDNLGSVALIFYHDGKEIKRYRVRDIVDEETFLFPSISHYSWLADSHYDDRGKRLTVQLWSKAQIRRAKDLKVPAQTRVFDVNSGRMLVGPGPGPKQLAKDDPLRMGDAVVRSISLIRGYRIFTGAVRVTAWRSLLDGEVVVSFRCPRLVGADVPGRTPFNEVARVRLDTLQQTSVTFNQQAIADFSRFRNRREGVAGEDLDRAASAALRFWLAKSDTDNDVEVEVKPATDGYRVVIWQLPAVPDRFSIIEVSKDLANVRVLGSVPWKSRLNGGSPHPFGMSKPPRRDP
jgi:hypothetical protein